MEKLSFTKYAERMGVSRQAVYNAVNAGKIHKGLMTEGKKKWIIPEIADKEWRQNHDSTYQRTTKSGKRVFESEPVAAPNSDQSSISGIKKTKLIFETQLKKLELDEKNGTLVNKQKVYDTLFGFGKEMRTAFLAIPDRAIDNIISAKTRNEAYIILQDEINAVLMQLADFHTRPLTSDR